MSKMGERRWAEFMSDNTRICRFIESRDMTEEELIEAGLTDSLDDDDDFDFEALKKSRRKIKHGMKCDAADYRF